MKPHSGTSLRTPRNFIESLSRGLSLLSSLAESSTPLSLTEIANRIKLSKSTVQRLIYTLHTLGYLEREDETKKYRPGPNTLSLALSTVKNLELRKAAYPILQRTSRDIGETVNLAILDGEEIVYVERIKTEQILNINLQIGSRLPAYCTSMGKALLAFLPEERLNELMNKMKLVPYTPNTITSKEALRRELKKVRTQGFATNNEELSLGLRSVAAPIRDYRGEVIAAVNIAVPSIRISQKRLETVLARKVLETAHQISFILGYKEEGL